MPRLTLTKQTVGRAGKDIGAGQPVLLADGAEHANDGKTMFKLDNTIASIRTVTFISPATILGAPALAIADQAFAVPASSERWIGPFPADIFNKSDGLLDIDVSADGVTITAVTMEGI